MLCGCKFSCRFYPAPTMHSVPKMLGRVLCTEPSVSNDLHCYPLPSDSQYEWYRHDHFLEHHCFEHNRVSYTPLAVCYSGFADGRSLLRDLSRPPLRLYSHAKGFGRALPPASCQGPPVPAGSPAQVPAHAERHVQGAGEVTWSPAI